MISAFSKYNYVRKILGTYTRINVNKSITIKRKINVIYKYIHLIKHYYSINIQNIFLDIYMTKCKHF